MAVCEGRRRSPLRLCARRERESYTRVRLYLVVWNRVSSLFFCLSLLSLLVRQRPGEWRRPTHWTFYSSSFTSFVRGKKESAEKEQDVIIRCVAYTLSSLIERGPRPTPVEERSRVETSCKREKRIKSEWKRKSGRRRDSPFFGGIWQLSSSVVFFFLNRSTTPSTQRLLLSLLPSPFVPHPAFPLGWFGRPVNLLNLSSFTWRKKRERRTAIVDT